jgi:restriction modification system DNA specificity domain protein
MKEDVLPEGWELKKLGSVVQYEKGKKPSNLNDEKNDIFTIPYIDIQGFEKGIIKSWTDGKNARLCQNSDLLMVWDGARAGLVGSGSAGALGSTLMKISFPKVNHTYGFYFLYSKFSDINSNTKGTGIPHVDPSVLWNFEFPIPPLPEQQYLSQKLTALLDEVAQTKQRLEAIPALLKQFRQSVLADAVSGRLTEEWRENNELSLSDWIQSNVGNIAKVETGKTPSRKNQEYWENGYIPWLTSSCTGLPYVNFADEFVTDLAVKECGLKIFNKNTLLLAMYGEGKTRGQVTELKLSATCNQACAAITANNNLINNQYLKLSLLKNYDEIRKSASGGNQPNLNLTKVREIKIHLPSLKEQTQIVQKVETYFALADEIETQVNAALENVNLLTQSILAKAFNGELSAAWRNSQVTETQGKV